MELKHPEDNENYRRKRAGEPLLAGDVMIFHGEDGQRKELQFFAKEEAPEIDWIIVCKDGTTSKNIEEAPPLNATDYEVYGLIKD